jgi:hypothetical protein
VVARAIEGEAAKEEAVRVRVRVVLLPLMPPLLQL